MNAVDVTTGATGTTCSTVSDDTTGGTGDNADGPVVLMVQGRELHRGLHLVENIARGVSKTVPQLRCVRIKGTPAGIVVEATDRYIVARALIAASEDASGLGDHLMEVETVKQVLRLAKESKTNPVTITLPAQCSPVLEVEGGGHQLRVPFSPDEASRYPQLSGLLGKHGQEGEPSPEVFALNPTFLAKLGTLKALVSDEQALVLAPSADPDKPIRFTAGDWLLGLVMPVRMGEETTQASRRAGELSRL